jgi:hypothetical protein
MRHGRRGGAAIEFALTLPAFIVLLTGVIDTGWLYYQQSALDAGVHAGCRRGSLRDVGVGDANWTEVEALTVAAIREEVLASGVDCAGCDVQIESLYLPPARSFRCTITRETRPLAGLLPAIDIDSQIVVRLEVQR